MINKLRSFFLKNKCSIKSFHKTVTIWGKENISLGENSRICEYVIIRCRGAKVSIGSNTDIGPFTVIFSGEDGVIIGNDVMIAPHCVIASGNHRFDNIDTTMKNAGGISKGPIIIEDDVWIGANCTITSGVIIRKGSIVGANSVVTKNTEPNSINCGVPAKFIRNRL
jgi:acetyltransferase-like isoleucine patch superfamily enzyme